MADEKSADARKRELIAQLERARANMSRDLGHVRYRSAVNDRVRESVRRHAGSWLTGASVAGLLAGWRLIGPNTKVKKVYIDANTGKPTVEGKPNRNGFWMGVLSFLFNLAQPAIMSLVQKRLQTLTGTDQPAQSK